MPRLESFFCHCSDARIEGCGVRRFQDNFGVVYREMREFEVGLNHDFQGDKALFSVGKIKSHTWNKNFVY